MKNAFFFILSFMTISCMERAAVKQDGVKSTGAIRYIDLDDQRDRQIVVDRDPSEYLGHPTTVLLEDGRTLIAVYPIGHGAGQILLKRSTDAGLTWSDRLPVPENWSTSKEVPTIFRVIGAKGERRLILFSGLYPARSSISEDDGVTWTPLKPAGDWGGIVVMSAMVRLKDGRYLAMFHDDGRFFTRNGRRSATMTLYKTFSADGGLTWSFPGEVFKSDSLGLCEPGIVRSPDGRELAVLLRENNRRKNSHITFSDDEGATWTAPRELPGELTGDRHTCKYAPDGRLLVSFRDMAKGSPTKGDWVAWVGTYDDLVSGRSGQYHVRLKHNTYQADCGYPGVEVLRDGTFVLTTYGHWIENEKPYIIAIRLKLRELDSIQGE